MAYSSDINHKNSKLNQRDNIISPFSLMFAYSGLVAYGSSIIFKKNKGRLMDPDIQVQDGYGVLTTEEEESTRTMGV